MPVSVVIPTYRRDRVLLETIHHLLRAPVRPREILVVDQTAEHAAETERELRRLDDDGAIRWHRLSRPSIPRAMNAGVLRAKEEIVLFLDDDVVPDEQLVLAHARAQQEQDFALVAGRVVQPWDAGSTRDDARGVQFSTGNRRVVDEFMGANFSVKRSVALALGGFDENFVRVAYRFEADFADRLRAAGERIVFEPGASVRHLKAPEGGTRAYGDHLRTVRPSHAVGEYYYLLRRWRLPGRLRRLAVRPFAAVRTRHHLRRPWWIPVTLTAELLGFAWAALLALRGPRCLGPERKG